MTKSAQNRYTLKDKYSWEQSGTTTRRVLRSISMCLQLTCNTEQSWNHRSRGILLLCTVQDKCCQKTTDQVSHTWEGFCNDMWHYVISQLKIIKNKKTLLYILQSAGILTVWYRIPLQVSGAIKHGNQVFFVLKCIRL